MLPETLGKQFDIFQAEKTYSPVQWKVTNKSILAGLIILSDTLRAKLKQL